MLTAIGQDAVSIVTHSLNDAEYLCQDRHYSGGAQSECMRCLDLHGGLNSCSHRNRGWT